MKRASPQRRWHSCRAFGADLGNALLYDPRVTGVAFTGSTETARVINRKLLTQCPPGHPGRRNRGINTMLVDSSALPEQVGAGRGPVRIQQCRAALFGPAHIVPAKRDCAAGAGSPGPVTWMNGSPVDPASLDTDMGPVIDPPAQKQGWKLHPGMQENNRLIYRGHGPAEHSEGYFVPPAIIEIDQVSELKKEVFGPVLHVLRYDAGKLAPLLSRSTAWVMASRWAYRVVLNNARNTFRERVRVGNVYVNRNMVGAVVGVQPFGGCGLSGTGTKAGGPHYLLRFTTEQTYTVNTAAIGGERRSVGGEHRAWQAP